jgi:hypothetical protein
LLWRDPGSLLAHDDLESFTPMVEGALPVAGKNDNLEWGLDAGK